jgi:hypothetical protein
VPNSSIKDQKTYEDVRTKGNSKGEGRANLADLKKRAKRGGSVPRKPSVREIDATRVSENEPPY